MALYETCVCMIKTKKTQCIHTTFILDIKKTYKELYDIIHTKHDNKRHKLQNIQQKLQTKNTI